MPRRAASATPPVSAERSVLLLRAINVGQRQLPMAALRALAEQLDLAEARTYLASGNLVARIQGEARLAARRLEQAITEHFGFHSDVIVRSAAQWAPYLADNPLAEAAAAAPNRVMLLLANQAPAPMRRRACASGPRRAKRSSRAAMPSGCTSPTASPSRS